MAEKVEIKTSARGKAASPDDEQITAVEKAARASKKFLKQAAEWATEQAEAIPSGGYLCPFCHGRYGLGEETDGVVQHIIDKHETQARYAFQYPELGFDAYAIKRQEEQEQEYTLEDFGSDDDLRILDDLNHFDYLHVPENIKRRIEVEGGNLRWVAPHNVNRFKDKGLEVMQRPDDVKLDHQHSHEDSTMRTNELVLMRVPPVIKNKLARLKQLKIEQQGSNTGSKELQAAAQRGVVGERAYEHFKQRGMSHDNAVRMADRAERAAAAGGIPREQGERRYMHNR